MQPELAATTTTYGSSASIIVTGAPRNASQPFCDHLVFTEDDSLKFSVVLESGFAIVPAEA
jgi:hypothetical protein